MVPRVSGKDSTSPSPTGPNVPRFCASLPQHPNSYCHGTLPIFLKHVPSGERESDERVVRGEKGRTKEFDNPPLRPGQHAQNGSLRLKLQAQLPNFFKRRKFYGTIT